MESILGQTISHYRIVAPLGESATAYKAEDVRSGLAVLLRFLSEEAPGASQAFAQFQQTARTLARLNHRHIAAVYDCDAWNGRPFWVTELPEGETLKERIAGHPIAFRELLDLSVQIVEAIDAAHSAGVVHGGLQPASVFVTRLGDAKVADFGLAGLSAEAAVPLGYQAPEQVRAEPPDQQSDLFSLGAMLYEMATGQPPFPGPNPEGICEAILEQDPPPASEKNPDLPARFDEVVSKALEKDRYLRYRAAADVRADLRRLRRDWDSARVAATRAALADTRLSQTQVAGKGAVRTAPAPVPPRSKRGMALTIATVLVLGAAIGAVTSRLVWRPARRLPTLFYPLTFGEGRIESARFGSGGQTVFYTAEWDGGPPQVFSVSPDSPESVPLGLSDAHLLSISPSSELAILTGVHVTGDGRTEGDLKNMALAGGAQQPILENVEAADWAPGGRGIAVVRRVDGVDRLEYPRGNVLARTVGWISDPRFSPQSDRIAFVEHPTLGDDAGSVDVVNLSGQKEVLSEDWGNVRGLAWSPEGKEVWFTAARRGGLQLYAVGLSGQISQLAAMAGSLRLEDVAQDGRVLLLREDSRLQMAEVVRGQTSERDLSWMNGAELCDVSADGKTVLFTETGLAGGTEDSIYIRGTDGSAATRLGPGRALALSPDGKLALGETIGATSHLVLLPTGAGAPVNLPATTIRPVWAAWLPGGKRFVLLGRQPGRELRLFVQDVPGGPPQAISPAGLGPSVALSPDGRTVVATGPDGKAYLYPIEGGSIAAVRGLAPDDTLVGWSQYGRQVYVAEGTLPVKIFRLSLVSGAKTPLFQLAPARPAGVVGLRTIRVTPDGRLCVFSYRRTLSRLYLVEGLR